MARGQGSNKTDLSLRGKSKYPLSETLERMQACTRVRVWGPWWAMEGNHNISVNVAGDMFRLGIRPDWAKHTYGEGLVRVEGKTPTEAVQKLKNYDLQNIPRAFRQPSGLPKEIYTKYWQEVCERAEAEFTKIQDQNQEFNIQRGVRHNKLRYEGGRLLLIRLGPLSPQKQDDSVGRRSPLPKGIWAFPWPYFEMFFAAHQLYRQMPKRLNTDKLDPDAFTDDQWNEIYAQRDAWLKKHAPKPKTFWYGGDLYTHYGRNGNHLGSNRWERMSVGEFVRLAPKILPEKYTSYDELELFIPGKERGHHVR